VLDAFCYAGGFGLQAARQGATRIVGIDQSETALALAQNHAEMNGLADRMEWVRADVFEELARREEEADPQRSVTDKQRRQRALPSQTLRAAGLSGLDCVGSGGTDRRRTAPPLTALPNPEFPSRRTPPHFQTGS